MHKTVLITLLLSGPQIKPTRCIPSQHNVTYAPAGGQERKFRHKTRTVFV